MCNFFPAMVQAPATYILISPKTLLSLFTDSYDGGKGKKMKQGIEKFNSLDEWKSVYLTAL